MNLKRKKLFERILWAKENLRPVEPKHCIVWEQPGTEGETAVTVPSPEWLASALHGGILPPVEVYLQIRCRWTRGDECFTDLHTCPGKGWKMGEVVNGHLLHLVKPIGPMTEEEAMEYLLQKDVPRAVWADHGRTNRPRFCITERTSIPKTRGFRDAWALNYDMEMAA